MHMEFDHIVIDFEVEPKHSLSMKVFLPIATAKKAGFNAIFRFCTYTLHRM